MKSDLGVPGPWAEGLPASWRHALRICPFCVSAPPEERARCLPCRGTGDLLGVLLEDAFERGRQQVLAALADVERLRRVKVDEVRAAPVAAAELKRAMGLG